MTYDTVPPADMLAQLRTLHQTNPEALDHQLPDFGLHPLSGGRNNRVYTWNSPRGEVCLKLYKTDKRDRAGCEFTALTHLAAHGITAAPRPLWHDPDAVLPAVAMTGVPGVPLPDLTDPHPALRAAIDVLARLRHLPLGPFSDLPRVDSTTNYLHRITKIWPDQLREQRDEPLTADLMTLLDTWRDRGDAEVLAAPAPPVLSRGDSNLLNWHWDDHATAVHVVDWEFIGHSDTTYDAAELVEHLSAHDIDDAVWIALLPELGVTDDHTRRRFLAAQRTVALRWLAVLWKRRHQRVDEFDYQFGRVRQLHRTDFL